MLSTHMEGHVAYSNDQDGEVALVFQLRNALGT